MHEIVFNDSFSLEKTNDYILSIQVSLDGFSFSILHENHLLAFKCTPLKISNVQFIARRFKEWIAEEELLKQRYKNVDVVVNTPVFTAIPNELFLVDYKEDLLLPLFDNQPDSYTESDFIEKFNAHLLFAVSKELKHILLDSFQQVAFIHLLSVISKKLPQTIKENGIVLYFNTQNLYILTYTENKLLLANSFKNTHPNDTLFFILTAIKQLKISIKNTHLFLAGNKTEMEKSADELKKFFSETEPLKPNSDLSISDNFLNTDTSQLITLLQ